MTATSPNHHCEGARTSAPELSVIRERLQRRAGPVRRAAFAALRRGDPPSVRALSVATGLPASEINAMLDELDGHGLVRRNHRGDVVGIAGLSVEPTPHRLVLDGVALFTWCVIDAIGIPAALGVDAELATRCWRCHCPLTIRLSAGRPSGGRPERVWMPDSDRSVFEQFCSEANLFATAITWRAGAIVQRLVRDTG